MKWHNFLIYFSLWAGAILNFYSGASLLKQVAQYGSLLGGGLSAACAAYGLAAIAIGVYGIYVRFQLAGLRRRAATHLTMLYALIVALDVVDLVLVASLGERTGGSGFSKVFVAIVLLIANREYYRKREALFVN